MTHYKRHQFLGIPASFLLSGLLLLAGCDSDSSRPTPVFPESSSGALEINYPLDETLFPPDIVAPTFLWSDETEGVDEWSVLLRFGAADDVLSYRTTEPSWRPTEADWAEIKRRSQDYDAEVAIVGTAEDSQVLSAQNIRIRTSTDPVNDSIFYREVPLPFISAVQDPSKIRWRFGAIDTRRGPRSRGSSRKAG